MAFDREPAHDMPMSVFPGYLAGPGDAAAALSDFLDGRPEWHLQHADALRTEVIHQDAATLISLDQHPAAGHHWTITSYRGPDGPLEWRATLGPHTPAETALAVARRLSYALSQPTDERRDTQLWGSDEQDCDEQIQAEAHLAGWTSIGDTDTTLTHESPDGTAGLAIRGFYERPGSADTDQVYTLWAGPRGFHDPCWEAQFTRFTPPLVLLAALHTLTRPASYRRRASQIPMSHRARLRTHPLTRPRPVPAPSR